jgi:tol-pal system protein YbgF
MSATGRATFLACVVLCGACAHSGENPGEVARLNQTIEKLRVENASYARQIEELENRLFILNDQIESRKVNEEKAASPQLPTVTLHPTATSAPIQPATLESEMLSNEPEVEYAGEAAKPSASRPVLRLHGDGTQVSVTREAAPVDPKPTHPAREPRESSVAPRARDIEAVALYRRSYEQLRQGQPQEAAQGFREFLRQFPAHDLADNSQYWLGECFYDRKDFASAVREFRRVIERYPTGNKVPDALLKVGFSYLALGSVEAGRQTLEQLQRSYPRHEAAGLAATRLGELGRPSAAKSSESPMVVPSTPQVPKEVP